jgi:UDP-3-O-[3-hydroxymyristoyl] N-acetylglucosamine deacetylase
MNSVTLSGTGCFTGKPCAVSLHRIDGPVRISTEHGAALLLGCMRTESVHSTSILVGGQPLRTVEHLAAALAGLGIYAGVGMHVAGGEVPLLDGCAREFVRALQALGVPATPSPVYIAREFVFDAGLCRYQFHPSARMEITTRYESAESIFDHAATFSGDAADFAARIAPARTFMRLADADAYLALGQHATLAPEHVVVLGDTAMTAGAPANNDEPARHKLLDVLGDLYVAGGVPVGTIHATRPGHAATHAALESAYAARVLTKNIYLAAQ